MNIIRCANEDELICVLFSEFRKKFINALSEKTYVNIGIATGSSYIPFMHLLNNSNIPYDRLNLFLVDEYAGVDYMDEKSCAFDLVKEFPSIDQFHSFNTFDKNGYERQLNAYNVSLDEDPLDFLFLGIGNDGHFAFCNTLDEAASSETYKLL